MPSKTFVLGAGFSKLAGFPLILELKQQVLDLIERDWTSRSCGKQDGYLPYYCKDEFDACLGAVDRPEMGFEELLISLRSRLKTADEFDPSFVALPILERTCARVIWERQRTLTDLPVAYQNWATWMRERNPPAKTNAIVSLNWDLVAERALWHVKIPWNYTSLLKPHGSINWIKYHSGVNAGWQRIGNTPYAFYPANAFNDYFQNGVNEDMRAMILPGSPEEQGLTQIWDKAVQTIQERDVVVFIGYSLPAYDSIAAESFQRATQGKRIEVYVHSGQTLNKYRGQFPNVVTTEPADFECCPYAQNPYE